MIAKFPIPHGIGVRFRQVAGSPEEGRKEQFDNSLPHGDPRVIVKLEPPPLYQLSQTLSTPLRFLMVINILSSEISGLDSPTNHQAFDFLLVTRPGCRFIYIVLLLDDDKLEHEL